MTSLARLLFPLPAVRRSPATIFIWWESRRPAYNVIVGGTGLLTLVTVQAIAWLPASHLTIQVPWQVPVAYGICANLFYSSGFALEALLQKLWGEDVLPAGPTLFRHGLIFSVGLTLFPICIAWLGYLANVVRYLLS